MPKIPMKATKPTDADRAFRDALLEFLKGHLVPDTQERFLAIAAHAVGQILALQDQRTMTREMGTQIIMDNIEAGNAEVINALLNSPAKGRA